MSKKTLNQNAKYTQKLIDIIEPNFIYSEEPINRYKNIINKKTEVFNKDDELSKLAIEINSIEDCNLKNNSNKLILGDGDFNSPLMLIGEAPGKIEEILGLTYQGEAGDLLNNMLKAINIKRKNIYSAYSVNFRTPEDRKPTSQEINRYSFFLKKHISIIDPKIIILLGGTAMQSLTGINSKVSDERGKWKEIILINKTYPLIVTYSPSYLLRFPENKKYSWEDLKKIKQKIQDLDIKI